MDISGFECGCINTFYMVALPGLAEDGSLWSKDDFFYCDAQAVKGDYCPEFDLQVANKWAYQTNAFSCDKPNSKGHYGKCDPAGGCTLNST